MGNIFALYFAYDTENIDDWNDEGIHVEWALLSVERQVRLSLPYYRPNWTEDMRVTYITANGARLIVEEFLSENILVDIDVTNPELIYIDWNSSGDYAFAYFDTPSGDSHTLYLISLADESMMMLTENSFFSVGRITIL